MSAAHPAAGQQQPMVILKNRVAEDSEQAKLETLVANLRAASALLPVIRTSFGPRAHSKLLLSPSGGLVITRDGYAIVRDLYPDHPLANLVVQGAQSQDEEVGDGTTTAVIMTSSLCENLIPIVMQAGVHPAFLSRSLKECQTYILEALKSMSQKVDLSDPYADLLKIVKTTINTKQTAEMNKVICTAAIEAIKLISGGSLVNKPDIDIKVNIRLLQVPGGAQEETRLIPGCVIEKDVLHSSMRRRINNPRILVLNSGIEYKKGESQTTIEVQNSQSFADFLAAEERQVQIWVDRVVALKPDVVLCTKGVSEFASFRLAEKNITAFRRCKLTDLSRLCLASGATMASLDGDLSEQLIGTGCQLFEVKKHGPEYFSYFTACKNPKACTIVVCGQMKDAKAELIRNLQDALFITRSIIKEPYVVPGAGACELKLSQKIHDDLAASKIAHPLNQNILTALARVFEIFPQTLFENAGMTDVARKLLKLKVELSADKNKSLFIGIDGFTGKTAPSKELDVWDSLSVKIQSVKTAIETATLVTSIDEIVSITKRQKPKMEE